MEFQLDGQYQRADELLAGRNLQSRRMPRALIRPRSKVSENRREDRGSELRLPRLGLAPQHRRVASIRARRQFRQRAPTWANWGMSGPWLCAHLWEHYAFGGDREFLRPAAYPADEIGSARILSRLADRAGTATSPPVPRNPPRTTSSTPDGRPPRPATAAPWTWRSSRELFSNCIEAAGTRHRQAFAARLKRPAAADSLPGR